MCRTAECKEVTVIYVRPHGTRALSELFTLMHQKRYSTRENTFNFNVPTNNITESWFALRCNKELALYPRSSQQMFSNRAHLARIR